jgi:hypothetical protein
VSDQPLPNPAEIVVPSDGRRYPTGRTVGLVSMSRGETLHRADRSAVMSFGYFRTTSGLPRQ